MVPLVALSDLLCRMAGIGYGYPEQRQVALDEQPAFLILREGYKALSTYDWARLSFELEGYLDEVRSLVTALRRAP